LRLRKYDADSGGAAKPLLATCAWPGLAPPHHV